MCVLLATSVNATKLAEMKSPKFKKTTEGMAGYFDPVEKKAELYPISNYHVNRIVTPFRSPSIKLDTVEGVTYKQQKNVIYISTTSDRRIAAFITEQGDEAEAISLILLPKKLPPQEIILGQSLTGGSIVARKFEKSHPRISTIKEVLAIIAKGDIPVGYLEQNVSAQYIPMCAQNGLNFNFYDGQFFAGGDYMVSVGVVTNISEDIVELKENYCFSEGVVAVSAFPRTSMLSGQKSEVFVMYQRVKEMSRSINSKRASLIE